MHVHTLQTRGETTYAVVFDKGDEFMSGMLDVAREQRLDAARFTAIGAFSRATLGYFDRERRKYQHIPLDEQVEVLSLIGNIALDGATPKIHAHVVVGKADGSAHGGHILEAHIWPTLEVIVVESPQHLRRTIDHETGLALLNLKA
jgi:predicted DNA-binding protein with PD1-like motif